MPVAKLAATFALIMLPFQSVAAQTCRVAPAFTRADEGGTRRVQVYEAVPDAGGARALIFVSTLKVNTDGTRISYHADDPTAQRLAINNIANAMRNGVPDKVATFRRLAAAGFPLPATWQALLPGVIEKDRRTGKPCLDADRYLVSKTSEVAVDGGHARDGDCAQAKWLDALDVNALVLPSGRTEFAARGADNRTPVVAMTLQSRRIAYGLVGDKGPTNELGEASVAMNRTLNGLPDSERPANYRDAVARFQAPRSIILLLPGTANRIARPLSGASVTAATRAQFERWGGQARLDRCMSAIPEAR
ncbi:MAG: glycoside hydrolase family 75 protein [Sphingomonas adhaesiva]|uniref:hypothetical protein n=1 Tax=Sphingomonas adhaesiva TaxID=28212 RepID=UPI002FFAC918